MPTEEFLVLAVREFKRLKQLADDAIAQISEGDFFAVPGEGDNSIAIIVKHVAGNSLSRWTDFLTADGEKPGRDRDREFEIGPADSRVQLLTEWERGWAALFAALTPLTDRDLDRKVSIRGEPLTVLQATSRQLTHYAYHVGQIVYVAKHQRGVAWKSLSIPRGGSAQFNQAPKKYIG